MAVNIKPVMEVTLLIKGEDQDTTYTVNVNDKVTDLVYVDNRNQEQTVSGTITGMTVVRKPQMPYEPGHADATLFNQSSYEISKDIFYNEVPRFVVTSFKIKVETETPSFCSLYVPVNSIVSVGAVVPADEETGDTETTVIDHETTDASSGTVTPEVVETETPQS